MDIIHLTQKKFDDLPEYSISQPTGVVVGKTWKRRNYVFKAKNRTYNAGYLPPGVELIEERWFHCQYVESEKPGYVDTETKRIKIIGAMEIDKIIARFNERTAI